MAQITLLSGHPKIRARPTKPLAIVHLFLRKGHNHLSALHNAALAADRDTHELVFCRKFLSAMKIVPEDYDLGT